MAPPTLRESVPADGAVRVDPRSLVAFAFDEPMKRRTAERAVTIVPPVRWGRIDWVDTRLELTPAEPLHAGTTYVALLSGRAQDSHGNLLGAPHRITFTTGDSLPGGAVRGRVQPLFALRAAMVFAVPGDAPPRPDVARAISVAETDTGGVFLLPHLPPQTPVWIVAYTDRNDNGTYDEGEGEPWGWHPLPLPPPTGPAAADSAQLAAVVPQHDPRTQGLLSGILVTEAGAPDGAPARLVAVLESDSTVTRALAPQGSDGTFLWPLPAGRYRAGAFRDMDGDGAWSRDKGEPVRWGAEIVEVTAAAVAGPISLAPPPPAAPPAAPSGAVSDTARADTTRSME